MNLRTLFQAIRCVLFEARAFAKNVETNGPGKNKAADSFITQPLAWRRLLTAIHHSLPKVIRLMNTISLQHRARG